MKQPHFFALSSRLGMHNLPWKGNELNVGVEDGPDAILTQEFLTADFPGAKTNSFHYKSIDQINPEEIFDVIAYETKLVSALIQQSLQDGEVPVSIGGDHTVSLAPLHAVLSIYDPKTVGVLRIDSHPDIHLKHTSKTGNVHGMWMRTFLDRFDDSAFEQLTQATKIAPNQCLYLGNLDMEEEEKRFIDEHAISCYSQEQLQQPEVQKQVLEWCRSFEHLVLDIDIDAFDATVAPGTGIPAEKGLFLKDLAFLFATNLPFASVELVEVNPCRDTGQTVAFAQHLLQVVLSSTAN